MPKTLSDACIRAGWEAERDDMHRFLIEQKKFNPSAVEKFISNFIDSMVYAKLPCTSQKAIVASAKQYALERSQV